MYNTDLKNINSPLKNLVLKDKNHPVFKYLTTDRFRPIPSKNPMYDGAYFLPLKDERGVVILKGDNHPTIRVLLCNLDEFKYAVLKGSKFPRSTDVKYVSKDTSRLLTDLLDKLIEEEIVKGDVNVQRR